MDSTESLTDFLAISQSNKVDDQDLTVTKAFRTEALMPGPFQQVRGKERQARDLKNMRKVANSLTSLSKAENRAPYARCPCFSSTDNGHFPDQPRAAS